MLTQDDLTQIKNIIVSETAPLAKNIQDVQTGLNEVKKNLKDVQKRVKKIEKTSDIMIKVFDKEDVRLHKRITKVEEHLGFTSKN